jgi:hypoxia up-regulated 1
MSHLYSIWLRTLALVLLCVSALGSLIAIDLGGSYVKVAVVQAARKPISIAENEMSKRQTPVIVGFANGQRFLGEDAVTMSGREPDKFIEHLRDLIGRRADDPEVQNILKSNFRNYDVVPDEKRGTVRFRIPGNDHLFSIEELVVRNCTSQTRPFYTQVVEWPPEYFFCISTRHLNCHFTAFAACMCLKYDHDSDECTPTN